MSLPSTYIKLKTNNIMNTSTTHLLSLPREIRDQILRYVVMNVDSRVRDTAINNQLTCHQLRAEVVPIIDALLRKGYRFETHMFQQALRKHGLRWKA